MSYLALDLEYVSRLQLNELISRTEEISRMLSGLIKTL